MHWSKQRKKKKPTARADTYILKYYLYIYPAVLMRQVLVIIIIIFFFRFFHNRSPEKLGQTHFIAVYVYICSIFISLTRFRNKTPTCVYRQIKILTIDRTLRVTDRPNNYFLTF